MTKFVYPALFEPGEAQDVIVVTFPDVPEAITEGGSLADARAMAADALGLVLLAYVRAGRPLPRPSARGALESVSVEPEVAAKLALIGAFRASGLSQRAFARQIDKDEKEVRRLLDPMHPTKLAPMSAALAALGQRLVVSVEPVPLRAEARVP